MMRSGHKYLFLFFVAVTCMALAVPARAAFTTTKRLYIDGAFVGSNTVAGLTYTYERITLASEGNRWTMYNCLLGMLDEFSIYEGVLDPCAVKDHYDAAGVGEASYVAEVGSDSPLIYLRFNDPNSADGSPAVRDPASSVNRDGTYISAVGQAAGLFTGGDLGAVFPGNVVDANNRGCVDIWDGDQAYAHEDVSIEVWVKSANLDDDFPRLFQHNGDWLNETAYGASTDANDGGVMQVGVIGGNDTSFFATPVDINDGSWHQIVVTYDTNFVPVGYETEVLADNPLIYFQFEQDDIAHDVNVINSGSKTVPAKFLGAAQPQPRFCPGIAGKGVFLNDETKNTVVITSPAYEEGGDDRSHLYAMTPGDISIEIWFRSRPYTEYSESGELNWARLFSNNGEWGTITSPRIMLTYNAYGMFGGGGDGEDGNGLWCEHPGFDPNADPNQDTGPGDREWHHAVATYDVNDADPNNEPNIIMQFYLDGVLLGTRLQDPNVALERNAILGPEFREFLIGAEASSGNRYNCFRGAMDEFALYGYILQADRVLVHYQEGLASAPWKPETCAQIFEQDWDMAADVNADCKVNFKDMIDVANNWWRCMGYDCPDGDCDESCETPWLGS